jgi:sodium/hydrogen antiporter
VRAAKCAPPAHSRIRWAGNSTAAGGTSLAECRRLTAFSSLGFLEWLALLGLLLLTLGLGSAYLQRLPISSSAVYLALGFALGPQLLGWLELKLEPEDSAFERLTEIAVVIALFISGLKLRLPLRDEAWSAAYRLAGPVMVVCIAGVAAFAHLALGLPLAHALLLGAVLAPTDPVLASAIAVSDASDRDRLRYGLSGEAGLNDGVSFPFVVLALEAMRQASAGPWLLEWFLVEIVWAVPAALLLGYALGKAVGRWAIRLRSMQRDAEAPSDFVALALIGLSYTAAHLIHSWGFLAVFAAGVGLRRAELSVVAESPHPELPQDAHDKSHPPAEHLVAAHVEPKDLAAPAVAAGVLVSETLSFGSTAERLLEVVLVVFVGACIGTYWDFRGAAVAGLLFFVIRPLATRVALWRTPTSPGQRWLMGWFGVRGIGSLYYLAYALNNGVAGAAAFELVSLTLTVVAISIVLHGISATPLLNRFQGPKRRGSSAAG